MVTGPWFNIKMSSCRYWKSHYGDKTVVRSSYLHNGISYTGKMTFLYWIRGLVVIGIITHLQQKSSYFHSSKRVSSSGTAIRRLQQKSNVEFKNNLIPWSTSRNRVFYKFSGVIFSIKYEGLCQLYRREKTALGECGICLCCHNKTENCSSGQKYNHGAFGVIPMSEDMKMCMFEW